MLGKRGIPEELMKLLFAYSHKLQEDMQDIQEDLQDLSAEFVESRYQ